MRSLSSLEQSVRVRSGRHGVRISEGTPLRSGAVADGSAAGFENSRTATCGDRHLTAPPFWKANRPGRRHRLECEWYAVYAYEHRALSLPPNYGNVIGQESGARSKRDGWLCHWGSGPHVSASQDRAKKSVTADAPLKASHSSAGRSGTQAVS